METSDSPRPMIDRWYKKPNAWKDVALAFLSVLSLTLIVVLAVGGSDPLAAKSNDSVPLNENLRAATPAELARSNEAFLGGIAATDALGNVQLTPIADGTTTRLRRYELHHPRYPNQTIHKSGATHIHDKNGVRTHRMHLSVLRGGHTTVGSFGDRFGQHGFRSIRIGVLDEQTGDRFFLLPHGLSMTWLQPPHNSTLYPDLWYFVYQKRGTPRHEAVVSFCSTAAKVGTCFLGHGQAQWDTAVNNWAIAYARAAGWWPDESSSSSPGGTRRILGYGYGDDGGYDSGSSGGNDFGGGFGDDSSDDDASEGGGETDEQIGADLGGRAGGWAGGKEGGKLGSAAGSAVGTDVGEWAGGAVGGAVAGPVGAAVGAEVGGWAGGKIGGKIGGKVGGEVGTAVGTELGTEAGGAVGSEVGKFDPTNPGP